jgi:tripartite ATP-independent transporter DctM subunit
MDLRESLDLIMFVTLCALLLAGFPVALTLGGVSVLFALIGVAAGVFDWSMLAALPSRIFGTTQNETLIAVPLFVFMGVMLEKSKVAEELLDSMARLFGPMRGGLGISVFIVGGLLAASTGIVGATVVTMGLMSLPVMLRRGYWPSLASGSIAASGTLGQIIPPSIVLVLLGDVIASSYQQAQTARGETVLETVTVGDMFAGALIPGVVLVGFYILYQIAMSILFPASSPAIPREDIDEPFRVTLLRSLKALVAPVLLIVAVLGSIIAGVATPTEAAAVGAIGATLLAGFRIAGERATRTGIWPPVLGALAFAALLVLANNFDLRFGLNDAQTGNQIALYAAMALTGVLAWGVLACVWRTLFNGVMKAVVDQTAQLTAMVFLILIGAAMFSLVFRGYGGDDTIHHFLSNLPGGETGALIMVMLVMFVLGFFIDFIEIVFIVVPIVAPILLGMGVDPIWLGVMMAMNLQTSFLTPPFGFALFYLRAVAPPSLKTLDIYKGVVPFVLIQIGMLVVLWFVPELATWLPSVMGG